MAAYTMSITPSNLSEKKALVAADTLTITVDRSIPAVRLVSEGGAAVYRRGAAPDSTHGSPISDGLFVPVSAPPAVPLSGWTIHVDPSASVTFGAEAVDSAWGSVLSAASESPVGEARIRAYVEAGAPLAVLEVWNGTTWVTEAGPVAPDQTNAGSATQGVTPSGTGFDFSAAYATVADQPAEGNSWVWELDGGGGLGVALTLTDEILWLSYSGSQPASGTVYAAAGAGVWGGSVGSAGGVYALAGRSNVKIVAGEGGNTARDLANATVSEPLIAFVACLNGGDGHHDWLHTTGGVTYVSTGTTSAATGASMASPVFGFLTLRSTLAGASTTITDCVAILSLPPGTWSV